MDVITNPSPNFCKTVLVNGDTGSQTVNLVKLVIIVPSVHVGK